VYLNGALNAEFDVAVGETHELPLTFEADAFVTVEVDGEPNDLYTALAPGFRPFAFTNPIFVDADSDGTWQAPGLPSEAASLPETILEALPR
jgi:hypothetical protein